MKQKALLVASFALAAGASFLAGRASSSTSPGDSSTSASIPPTRLSGDRTFRPSSLSKEDRTKANSRELSNRTKSTDLLVQDMVEIMNSTNSLARTQAWLDFVRTLEPGRFQEVVDQFRTNGLTDGNMTEYGLLLTAWAKADPLSALDYAEENTGTRFARNTILTSWAGTDPYAAIQWAEDHHEGDDANPWMVGVIKGIAANDPALATQLLTEMPYSGERGDAMAAMIPQILAQGTDSARDWVTTIEDERLRNGAMSRLAESLARTDPEGTADWLASNSTDATRRSMDNVIRTWASQDLTAATNYFENLPAGDARTNALRGLASHLAGEDPQQAAALIDQYPNDASDRVYQQFVWESARQDPALAADYISRISNENERESTYRRILDRWLRRDFEGATTWMASNELPQSVSNRLQSRIRDLEQRQQ
ncbi:MAG: hypothetical protein ACQKBU_08550 [Verrucomicrobiales bacterium]